MCSATEGKVVDTDVEEQLSPLLKHSSNLEFGTAKPTICFSESPVDSVSPTFIEEEKNISPVHETLEVAGNISVGVSPSEFILEEEENVEQDVKQEIQERHFETIEQHTIVEKGEGDNISEAQKLSSEFCRTKDTVVREDNVFTDSFDEPVSEDRREKLHDMAFENYAFSEEDAELEMITKQPISARSGREISPEDLRESFSEFDFDEREMKELKADFQQTGQQGVYQAKCSQHALSHRMPRDEGHGIDQPLNEADEDEMLGEAAGGYLAPQDNQLLVSSRTPSDTSTESSGIYDEATEQVKREPWEVASQFKRQFSEPFEEQEECTHIQTAQSIDMGTFYRGVRLNTRTISRISEVPQTGSDDTINISEQLSQSAFWQSEPHELISETHEQTVIASILESRQYEQECLQRSENEEVESAEVAVQFPESFVLNTLIMTAADKRNISSTAYPSLQLCTDRPESGEDLFAREDVTTETSITPVKENLPLETEEVVSRASRLAHEELLQESSDERDRSISPSIDSEEMQDDSGPQERPSYFASGKFPIGLSHFGKNLADNEIYESSETGGDTTEEKLSPIEETPTDEFPEEQEENIIPATEKRVTFQTDTDHLQSISSEELIKTSTSSSEMEPTLLAASYDLESGHVSRVVTTYDMSPDSVEKQFHVPAMTKAILSSPEDDVFEEESQSEATSPNLLAVSHRAKPLQVSSSTESYVPSPPAPTPKDPTNGHDIQPDLEGAAIKLQDTFAEQETEETETDNTIILDQEIQQIEVEIDVPTKESKDDSEQEEPISPFEVVSPTDLEGYNEYMEEYEKVQMLKSTESVVTSSFVDVGEMEKSGQSLEIVSPVDSTPVEGIPVHPYDKSESSFEHSSPISSEASEKGSPFDIPHMAEFSNLLPDLVEASTVVNVDIHTEYPEKSDTRCLPNGPTEVDYSPTIDLDYSYGEASARHTEEVNLIRSVSPTSAQVESHQEPTTVDNYNPQIVEVTQRENVMIESNTEGLMESLQSVPEQDRLLMSDQTLYGLDMPSEESGLHSLSTSLLETSVKHDTEADLDSVSFSMGLTSQGDEEASDQSENRDITMRGSDKELLSQDSGKLETLDQAEKTLDSQEEPYAQSPVDVYPGKRALQLTDEEQQKSLEKEAEMEILVRSSEDLEDLLDDKNIETTEIEEDVDDEIVEISKHYQQEQEVVIAISRTDESGATSMCIDDFDAKSTDDALRPVSSESYFSQLDFTEGDEEQQDIFDLRVDSADLDRPVTPTPVDPQQHTLYDNETEENDDRDAGIEDREDAGIIEGAAGELVDSVIYEAYTRVQRDENSNDDEEKSDVSLKSGESTEEENDDVPSLEASSKQTIGTGAKLIRQLSEDIPEITITQHLHDEDSDDETYLTSYSIKTEDQPITEQKQTDEEKELFVEQEEILSACQSQQIMSQIHGAGITATCIPEEDEEVEEEILPQSHHTTSSHPDRDFTDYGPTCIPEEEDVEEEIKVETVSKSSATRPLQVFPYPGTDTTDSKKVVSSKQVSSTELYQQTVTSYSFSETKQSTHVDKVQMSSISHDLVMLEDSINEGDKNQMSSNDESVEEYKEDDGLENIIGSESQSEKVDDTEKSTDEDHFFELASGLDTLENSNLSHTQSEHLNQTRQLELLQTESTPEDALATTLGGVTPTENEFNSIVKEENITEGQEVNVHDDAGDSSSIDSFTTVVAAEEQEDDDEKVDNRMDDFGSMTSSFHSDIQGPEEDSHEQSEPLVDWGQQPVFDIESGVFPSDETPIVAKQMIPITVKHAKSIDDAKHVKKQDIEDNEKISKTEKEPLRQKLIELEVKHEQLIQEDKDDEDFGEGPLIEWGPRDEEGSESSFESDRYEYIDKTALSIITEISDEDKFEMIDKDDMMSESLSDRPYSSPEYPPPSPGNFKGKSGDKDDISVTSSLLEFERLEHEIEQGGSQGSIDDKNSLRGCLDDRQFMYNKSSDRDDVSITSSLAEFERFERELAQSSSTSSVEKIPSSDSKSSDVDGSRSSLADSERLEQVADERRSSTESFKQRSETSSMASLNEFEKIEQELQLAEELEAEAQKIVCILKSGTLFAQQQYHSQTSISEERTIIKDRDIDNDSIDGKDDLEDSLGDLKSSLKDKSQGDADSLDGDDVSDITSMTSSVIMVGGDLMSTSQLSQTSQTSQKSSKSSSKEYDVDSLHDDSLMKISTDSLGDQFGLKPMKDKDKWDNDSLLDQEGIMDRSTDSLENEHKVETDSLQAHEDVMQTSGDSLEDQLGGGSDKQESIMESSFYSVTSSNFSRSSAETMRSAGSRSDSSTDIMQVSKESMEERKKREKDWLIDNYHSYKTTGYGSPFIDYQGNVEPELTSFHIDDNYEFSSKQSDYSEDAPITSKPFSWGPYEERKRIYTMAEWEAMKEEKRKASINPQDKPDGDDDDDDKTAASKDQIKTVITSTKSSSQTMSSKTVSHTTSYSSSHQAWSDSTTTTNTGI